MARRINNLVPTLWVFIEMKEKYCLRWLVFVFATLGCSFHSAYAHHSFAFEFDADQQGSLTGEITEVRFVNPHVVYRMQAEQPDGTEEDWQLQTHNVGVMLRLGWTAETIQAGDRIEVSGSLGRGGARKLSIDSVILADGSRRDPKGGELADAYTTDEVNADPNAFYGVTTNVHPVDITGAWSNRYKFQLTVDDLEPKPTPFTDEGRAKHEATENWHDPSKRCKPGGLPRTFGTPTTLEIFDAGSYYLMINSGYVRRIWLDGREPPKDLFPGPMGFSRGEWDGEVFVIETTHLEPGWLDGSGLPMSGEGTRLVETYAISEDRLTMERKMTIYDPYYTEPLVRVRGSARDDNIELVEGGSGCDPVSFYRDLWDQGLLESLWKD